MTYPTPPISHITTPDRSTRGLRGAGSGPQTRSPLGEENAAPASYSLPLLSALLHRVAEDMDYETPPRSLLPTPQASRNLVDGRSGSSSSPDPEAVEAAVREVTARLRRYLIEDDSDSCSPQGDTCAPSASASNQTGSSPQAPEKHSGSRTLRTPARSRAKGEQISLDPSTHQSGTVQPSQLTGLSGHTGHTGHTVDLFLLGHPQIYIDGTRVAELERSDRRSQVIQLLALHHGTLGCDQLAEAISMTTHQYEDEPIKRHYVRTLVWRLRDRIGKTTGWRGMIQSPTKGGSGSHYYQLTGCIVCDLWEFEDKLDEADRLVVRAAASRVPHIPSIPHVTQASGSRSIVPNGVSAAMGDEDRAAALREEALQLYRGEFCEGSNVGQIVQAARMLEERYLRSALQQGDYWRARAIRAGSVVSPQGQREEQGEQDALNTGAVVLDTGFSCPLPEQGMAWREALRNYERVLRIDNYHEEAYRYAMECYARLGNVSGVGQIFARCQDILHADLMQPPGENVVRVYEDCKTLLGVS